MKQVFWLLLLIPLLQACAIHAPMSEMVMFNKSFRTDSLEKQEQVSFTINNSNPSLNLFQEQVTSSFLVDDYNLPQFTVSGLITYLDKVSVSASSGSSWGVDGTAKRDCLFKCVIITIDT